VAVDGDRFVLRRDAASDSVIFGFSQVSKLEVSQGRHGRALTGLAVGLVGGAALGAITFAASDTKPKCPAANGGWDFCGLFYQGPGVYAGVGAVLGGLSGGVLGTVIGSFIHTERWRAVSVDRVVLHPQASISVMPSQSGPQLALRLGVRF
jgi:hypothetical protein